MSSVVLYHGPLIYPPYIYAISSYLLTSTYYLLFVYSNVPLLLNLLVNAKPSNDPDVSDEWKDGLYAAINSACKQDADNSTAVEGSGAIYSAIQFVLMHSLRDMAMFAAKERASMQGEGSEQNDDSERKDGTDLSHGAQRMSRATASSLPCALSLLRRLISRPLIVDSQMSTALAKMKESDFIALVANIPQRSIVSTDTPKAKFNAVRFTRALHIKLARLSSDIWSDERFASAPAHVIHPFITYIGE